MEQNKLDTQFKEKLNSREIKPTDMAWDRLDAMLSVAENKKPKRKFTWLYIAASFIGFILISTVFFNQKENTIDIKKNTVVIENTIPKESSKTEINSIKKSNYINILYSDLNDFDGWFLIDKKTRKIIFFIDYIFRRY